MSFTATVVIASYGDRKWSKLARDRAYPSTGAQGFMEAIIWHEPEKSLATARNRAGGRAKASWLCFLDADDELAPGYLKAMMRVWLAERDYHDRMLLVPAVQYVYPDGTEEPPRVLNTGRPLLDINRAVIGTMIERDFFEELGGFRDDLDCYEDWAIWCAAEAAGAALIDVPAAVYRAHVNVEGRNVQGGPCAEAYRKVRAEHGITV